MRFATLRRGAQLALPLVCLLWAGVTIGVSFIATPAKFLAPTLERAVALDVGRHTFAVAHGAQLVLAALAIGCVAACRRRVLVLCAVGALLVQALVLLPPLDARAAAVIAGTTPSGSSPHALYVGLEVIKVVALVWAAIRGQRVLAAGRPRPTFFERSSL